MRKNVSWRGRAGFTLIEVLVTLVLLAVLAAAVFPVVTQQSEKAEAPRFAGDLAALRAGIEAFRLDVRPYYPQDLEDLVHPISAASDVPLLPETEYGAGGDRTGKWNGPYIDADLEPVVAATPTISTAEVETAYDASVQPALTCVLATGTASSAPCASGEFVALQIDGVDAAEAAELEEAIDGGNGGLTTGKFRHAGGVTTTAFYVVGPYF